MPCTRLTVRRETALRLKAAKTAGESYSDLLERLLESQPAKCVKEWLESLAPLKGRGVFTPEERARLMRDQRMPRDSHSRRTGHAQA
jgi:predicted CopG family antitoxin